MSSMSAAAKSPQAMSAKDKALFFTEGLTVFVYLTEDENKIKNKATSYEEDIPEDKFFTGVVVSVNQEAGTALILNDKSGEVHV